MGAPWLELAERTRSALVAFDSVSGDAPDPSALVAQVRERFPEAELVLVLRAASLRNLALRLLGKPPLDVDRLVLSLPLNVRAPLLPLVPTLMHTPLDPPERAPADHAYVRTEGDCFLDAARLPAAMGDWLSSAR